MPCAASRRAPPTPALPFDAVKTYATLQESTDVFREIFGVYQEPVIV
jgi:hypothetical protein